MRMALEAQSSHGSACRKAQSSLEMLAIFAGIMMVLLVVAAALPNQAAGSQVLRERQMARDTVQTVAQTANDVYLAGDGAVRTMWIEIPEGMNASASFIGAPASEGNWSKRKLVNINLDVSGDTFYVSRAPVCGTWPASAGRMQVNITYNSSGTAHVMVNELGC